MGEDNLYYIFNSTPGRALFIFFDVMIISIVYLLVGFNFSTFLNLNLTRPLDRAKQKLEIFFEILIEALVTLILILLSMHFIPMLPTLLPFAEPTHLVQRLRGKDFLLIFSIVACQKRFQDKIRFLLNEEEDSEKILNKQIREDYENCPASNGFVCKP